MALEKNIHGHYNAQEALEQLDKRLEVVEKQLQPEVEPEEHEAHKTTKKK